MKYLVVQEWDNTKGNHAGMSHMCDMLVDKYPGEYIKITKETPNPLPKRNRILSRLLGWYDRKRWENEWKNDYMTICQSMFEKLKEGDEVFLLEYNWPGASQYKIAKYIRKNFPYIKIRTLSHITPTLYERVRAEKFIPKWCSIVDTVMTMGHDLTNYFENLGIPRAKISTGFHYVDNEFYKIQESHIQMTERPTIIAIGALQRDFQMLADIVNNTPEVNWIICRGRKNVDFLFSNTPNVRLVGFVPEDDLRELMASSDASLNVLEDTVGSNVITTSMAMGLAIIVSDVGSIRDYADDTNAIFCSNIKESFVEAIKRLSRNPSYLVEMRKASISKIDNFTIDKIHEWFNNL